MKRTLSLQLLARNTVCAALALAVNAGAAWGFVSLDTKGERHLAAAARSGNERTYVVYLGELPEVRVCGARGA